MSHAAFPRRRRKHYEKDHSISVLNLCRHYADGDGDQCHRLPSERGISQRTRSDRATAHRLDHPYRGPAKRAEGRKKEILRRRGVAIYARCRGGRPRGAGEGQRLLPAKGRERELQRMGLLLCPL